MSSAFKQFHATELFLFPLKALYNLWFSNVFKGYKKDVNLFDATSCVSIPPENLRKAPVF